MLDAVKRLAVIGVGAVRLAENEIQEAIAELRHKGELSEEEGKKVLGEWRSRVDANKREVEELVDKAVQSTVNALSSPSREEFNALLARVEKLESGPGQEQP